jgi:hypothetical protein
MLWKNISTNKPLINLHELRNKEFIHMLKLFLQKRWRGLISKRCFLIRNIPFFLLVTFWYPGEDIDKIYIFSKSQGLVAAKLYPSPLFEKTTFLLGFSMTRFNKQKVLPDKEGGNFLSILFGILGCANMKG